MINIANRTIAYHLIFTGYGHWLSNDLRGSGSDQTRKESLKELGPVHFGRKKVQPARGAIREFYRRAEGKLDFHTLWFDESSRNVIGNAFGEASRENGYTVYACAVCSNHAHLCVRVHRDNAVRMWDAFANAARIALVKTAQLAHGHPVWSSRAYQVFLKSAQDVVGRIRYVEGNPIKEGIREQKWNFVVRYDGWTFQRKTREI